MRTCMLAGKIMAIDAARHVEVLNIMNTSELAPSAARRFANVTDVNILSLITATEDDGDTHHHTLEITLSVGTATRSVPFLMTFPKLKRAFLGGLHWYANSEDWLKCMYTHSSCHGPEDHRLVFQGLVDHLCGAFQSRSLSPRLKLGGVIGEGQLQCSDNESEDGRRCRRCWDITTSFPPAMVLGEIPLRFTEGLCLSYAERIDALATRPDNPLIFQPQENITECFLRTGEEMFGSGSIYPEGDLENSFIERVKSQGGYIEEVDDGFCVDFHYISVNHMKALKKMAIAIGPSVINSIPKRELLFFLHPLNRTTEDGKKRVLVRQTFESLVQLGFDLPSKDFVLIDPLEERALQNYHALFRSEEEAS